MKIPPVWMMLAAKVRTLGKSGERTIPVSEIFAGYQLPGIAEGEWHTFGWRLN